VFCQTSKPQRSVTLYASGLIRKQHYIGNAGEETGTLGYGRSVTVGVFRCSSQVAGVRCTVSRSGRGFMISRAGITRAAPLR